jgi:sugar phosphate isomerase/epimerase
MIPVLHSVSYAGVWPGQARLTLEEFLGKAAELGFPSVMLMAKRPHLSVLDYGPEESKRLREAIEERGLQCDVIAGYNNFTGDAEHGDIPQCEMQIQHITGLARIARDLGAGVVRVFTSYEHPAIGYSQLFQRNVEALRECALRAADLGVTIGVQNHHDFAADHRSQRDLIEVIDEPNCEPIFDAWAPALHGTDIVEAAREMAPLICHTTAADYQLRPRFKYHPQLINYTPDIPWVQAVPMGEGFIDYTGFFREIAAGGYDRGVGYEMCAPLVGGGSVENLDRAARRFLEFMEPFV